jgi:hypothetical protein
MQEGKASITYGENSGEAKKPPHTIASDEKKCGKVEQRQKLDADHAKSHERS